MYRFMMIMLTALSLVACQHQVSQQSRQTASRLPNRLHFPPHPAIGASVPSASWADRIIGYLPIPVAGVSRRELRDTWGAARGQGRVHDAIDIMAPDGTPVYSTSSGNIASLKGNPRGGNVIWIVASDGTWHYYAHLERQADGLAVGQPVQQGQLIGYVGHSGNASVTAPHLHYAIYTAGKGQGAVNPYLYLR